MQYADLLRPPSRMSASVMPHAAMFTRAAATCSAVSIFEMPTVPFPVAWAVFSSMRVMMYAMVGCFLPGSSPGEKDYTF